MRVYYLSRKQLTNVMVFVLVLFTIGYLISNYLFQNLVVPTTEIDPIYQGSNEKKQISLAINVDWGEEFLPDMLTTLEENEVLVTFFLTGRWTNKFPELATKIVKKGHEIGNHGYSHSSPNQMSLEQNKSEITKTSDEIRRATGKQTVLFAPPSGERNNHVLKAAQDLGYTTVLWSVDTIDWKRPPSKDIINKVVSKAHNGAIVLMHPTKSTLEALPVIIKELKSQGYTFVTVSQNIELDKRKATNE